MGYETKIFIVEKHKYASICHNVCIDKEVYGGYYAGFEKHEDRLTEKNEFYYFLHDRNTKVIPPCGTLVKKHTYVQIITMFEMCKMGLSFGSICEFKDSDVAMFDPTDGNKLIGLDSYDSYRKFVPIDQAISILKTGMKEEKYWRFNVLLNTLQSVKKAGKIRGNEFGILEYGH